MDQVSQRCQAAICLPQRVHRAVACPICRSTPSSQMSYFVSEDKSKLGGVETRNQRQAEKHGVSAPPARHRRVVLNSECDSVNLRSSKMPRNGAEQPLQFRHCGHCHRSAGSKSWNREKDNDYDQHRNSEQRSDCQLGAVLRWELNDGHGPTEQGERRQQHDERHQCCNQWCKNKKKKPAPTRLLPEYPILDKSKHLSNPTVMCWFRWR